MSIRLLLTVSLLGLFGLASCADKTAGSTESVTHTVPEPRTPGGTSAQPGPRHESPTTVEPDASSPQPVPEPGTIFLFGSGLTGLALLRRRRRNKRAQA